MSSPGIVPVRSLFSSPIETVSPSDPLNALRKLCGMVPVKALPSRLCRCVHDKRKRGEGGGGEERKRTRE